MSERNKTILISFLLGFVASWLSSHLLEIAYANFFDDFSSGNVDLQDASDPSGVVLMNALARNRAGEIPVVDFSILTSFSWDRLYMFGDYTQPSDLDAIVGRSWRENCYTNISTSEGVLLVFTA